MIIAFALINLFFKPLRLVQEGIHLLKESNLVHSLSLVGNKEVDEIVHTYNKMLSSLRRERMVIQEKHFFLEKIIQASLTGIIILDYNEVITIINPSIEKLFQLQENQIIGKKISQLPSPFCDVVQSIEVGKSEVFSITSRKRVKCTKSEFFDQGFPRFFFMFEELTEELRLSEKAAYEKLIRVLSHEINNSLGAANSLLNTCLLYKDQIQEEDREDFEMALKVVISRTEHLSIFMKSYANVVKIQEPKKQWWNVVQILEEITLLYKAELQKRNIQLKWKIDEEAEKNILLDRSQMEQVFVNIIKNGMEAIKKDGMLTIGLEKMPRGSKIYIEDTGGGIPPEVKNNLFTPFFSTKENGQGIGLALIQEILIRHDFGYGLESEWGVGAKFVIEMS
ncbi:MAG: ATP-binding protein [Flammeovirgaceae bacterium]